MGEVKPVKAAVVRRGQRPVRQSAERFDRAEFATVREFDLFPAPVGVDRNDDRFCAALRRILNQIKFIPAAGDRDAADMVKLLARLMRRNIEVRDTPVPLQQELEMTEAYLKLQRYRFGDAVCYSLEADEAVRRLMVLPLLIQPLVENAFQHGVRNCLQGSRITVRAAAEGDRLSITVSDNGVGIPPDRLAELRARLGDEGQLSDTHIGLANVHQRIRLYYGAPYGMTLASTPGQGTVVTLSLPVLSDQSKEECIYDG